MFEYTFRELFIVVGGVVAENPISRPTWRAAMIRCMHKAPPGDLTAIFGFRDADNKHVLWNLGMSEVVSMNGNGVIDVEWPQDFKLPTALPHPMPDQTNYEAVYRVIPLPRLTFDNRDAAIMAALHLQPTL